MKILFLDVDGELTYDEYRNKETADIDIKKVLLLKQIVDKTNAKIVLTSSWKGYFSQGNYCRPIEYFTLQNILLHNGLQIYDETSYVKEKLYDDGYLDLLSVENMANIPIDPLTGRTAEVHNYIMSHDIDKFVILDDENYQWSYYGYDKYWIQPSWYDNGLKQEHVDKAIEILNS